MEDAGVNYVYQSAYEITYTYGYYKVTERVGEAFKDGLQLKK